MATAGPHLFADHLSAIFEINVSGESWIHLGITGKLQADASWLNRVAEQSREPEHVIRRF